MNPLRLMVKLPALFALLLIAEQASSQTFSLAGVVTDAQSGLPLSGTTIFLFESGQKKSTSSEGLFTFEHLVPGRYTVAVHHVAYSSVERVVVLTPGQVDTLRFRMTPALISANEVVVRSTRIPTDLDAAPFPMEVKSAVELAEPSHFTLPDALKASPGIALVRDGSWETAVSIRGLSRSDVVSLVDNVRIETADDIAGPLSLVCLEDLERAEVIKTSGSTLYGTGAIGGVVQMVTKRASFTDQSSTSAEYTAGVTSVDGGASHHLALESSDEKYALRLSGGYRHAGNTLTPDGALPNSQYSDFNISGSLQIRTTGDQSVLLSYQRSQAENTGIPGGSAFSPTAAATYRIARRELFSVEYQIPDASPSIPLVTVRLSRQVIARDVDVVQSPTLTLTPHAVHATDNVQVESRSTPLEDDLLTLGGEAWQRDLDSRRERVNTAAGTITGERPVPSSTFLSAGVYAQNEWHPPSSPLTLIAGARYDRIRVQNDAAWNPVYIISGGILQTGPPNQQLLWNGATVFNESWSANAGATYAVTEMLDATVLGSTAFRAPSLEERFQFIDLGSIVHVGNPDLRPEQSRCLDAALSLHSGNGKLRSDFFLNHLTDLVADIPGTFDGRNATVKTNIGEARLYGYEFSGEENLAAWSALSASLAYVRGEDTRNHLDLPQIAPLQGETSFTASDVRIGKVDVTASFAAAKANAALGEVSTAGFVVLDAGYTGVPLRLGSFTLSFRAQVMNILNKEYENFLSTLRGTIHAEPGRNFCLSATLAL